MSNEKEYIEDLDNEEELLEESQGANRYKIIFIIIGLLLVGALASIFYVFLKEAPPPVKLDKIKTSSVKEKEFVKPLIREPKKKIEETLTVFPEMPNIPTVIPKKIYKPKLIKGGGRLDITQSQINNKPLEKEVKKVETKAEVKVKKAYTGGVSTVAGIHHYNPNLSLGRGALIPCNMNTRLISAVSGQITCTIAEDIYSVNGNVLLLEKGSIAVGSYKSESLTNGMNRMYAIWDDIRTPNNVIVSVGSGTADELGSNGMMGEIDNHWGMRFGGAILVSIIEDALSAAVANAQNSGNINLGSTQQNSKQMSNTILEQYINIPPTLYKNHGDLINIFVNKDIDFSNVYGLER